MTDPAKLYIPITSDPFERNDHYCELLPCPSLAPYIRCFWGTPSPIKQTEEQEYSRLVIPDTCMDIIFRISESRTEVGFCPIDETPGYSVSPPSKEEYSVFAVRFFPWSAAAFAENPDMTVPCHDPRELFPRLTERLYEIASEKKTLEARSKAAEAALLSSLRPENLRPDVMNSLYFAIKAHGNVKVSDLAAYTGLSAKTLQRQFSAQTGMSPKVLCSLVRYQLLWQEMALGSGISILDAVEKYGYYDQSHLLNDFRRRHQTTPAEAMKYLIKRK